MGNISSFSSRYLVRKTKRFNVENRAHRFIDQEKLPAAPKHPSTSALLESLTKDPKVREELLRKNTDLDANLKQVYVKSLHKPYTIEQEKEKLKSSKLPQIRGARPDFKYGHTEPLVIPKGKYSMAQVINMLMEHLNDPMINTPQVLADKYSLDAKLIESIIYYFRMFKVENADTKDTQKLFAQKKMTAYTALDKYMEQQTIYKISTYKKSEDFSQIAKKLGEEAEAVETGTKPDVSEALPSKETEKEEEKKSFFRNRNEGLNEKQDLGIDIDSVYKNVGNRDRRRKKKDSPT